MYRRSTRCSARPVSSVQACGRLASVAPQTVTRIHIAGGTHDSGQSQHRIGRISTRTCAGSSPPPPRWQRSVVVEHVPPPPPLSSPRRSLVWMSANQQTCDQRQTSLSLYDVTKHTSCVCSVMFFQISLSDSRIRQNWLYRLLRYSDSGD